MKGKSFDPLQFILKHRGYATRPWGLNSNGKAREEIISSWIPEGSRVLDIGCSKGIMGKKALRRGCTVTGVEKNKKAAMEAKKSYHRVLLGDIEEKKILEQLEPGYQVIICADLLEHLAAPEELLLRLRGHFDAQGRLLISIPNVAHWSIRRELLAGNFDYQERGIMDKGHLRFFTRSSFLRLLDKTGYRVFASDFIYAQSPLDGQIQEEEKWKLIRKQRELFALQFLFNARPEG